MRRWAGSTMVWAGLLLVAALPAPGAEVYKSTDAWGRTVYSDKPATTSSKPVRNTIAPDPGAARYYDAVTRAEIDRVQLQRDYAENLQPRRIAVYNPRETAQPVPPLQPTYPRSRWDPALPPTPPPSLDRNYYYSGR